MQIHDFTNHLYDTIVIDRLATWPEFCRLKPNRVKPIITCTGEQVFVHKSNNRDKHHYWLWHCLKCSRTGIARADTLHNWVKSQHRCVCRRERKPYANTEAYKRCPGCCRSLPTTRNWWYFTKRGYLSFRCKRCSRIYNIEHYKYKHAQNDARRNIGGGFIDGP